MLSAEIFQLLWATAKFLLLITYVQWSIFYEFLKYTEQISHANNTQYALSPRQYLLLLEDNEERVLQFF